jgi:predicted Zn-dependent protease
MNKEFTATFTVVLIISFCVANSGCFESEKEPEVLGDYAKYYLQGSKYTKIIIEIDYVEGYAPSSQAQSCLRNTINQYCDKQSIHEEKDGFSSAESSYSDEDIRALENDHRDRQKSGDTIVVYILYLNGKYAENEDVLGLAYGPSSIAIFMERIYEIEIPWWATSFIDHTDYEKSVVVHEFGHLLALVNIGYQSDRSHESSNEHHCIHEECVMYYAIETVSIIDLITTEDPEPPYEFCTDCQHDLGKIKSGEY